MYRYFRYCWVITDAVGTYVLLLSSWHKEYLLLSTATESVPAPKWRWPVGGGYPFVKELNNLIIVLKYAEKGDTDATGCDHSELPNQLSRYLFCSFCEGTCHTRPSIRQSYALLPCGLSGTVVFPKFSWPWRTPAPAISAM